MEIKFTAKKYVEEDNSITLSLQEIDIIENGETEEKAKSKLAAAILEYAADFKNDFEFWSSAKNRKAHIPYIMEVNKMTIDNIIEQIRIEI